MAAVAQQTQQPAQRSDEDRVIAALYPELQESTPEASQAPGMLGQGDELAEGQEQIAELNAQPDQQQQPPEMEDIEFEDFKFQLPKTQAEKVKQALMRTQDYTKKSMETSAAERVVAEKGKALQAQMEFHQQSINDIANITYLNNLLGQYAKVNWAAMSAEEAMRTKIAQDQIKEAKEAAERGLNAKWQQFNQRSAEAMNNLARASEQQVTLRIPGFNQKSKEALFKYVTDQGYSPDHAKMMFLSPLDVIMVDKARKYDELQASKPDALNRAKGAPPMLKPNAASKQQNASKFLSDKFKSAKSPEAKKMWAEEIMARKLGEK